MIRRAVPLILLLLISSAVLGWLRAGTVAGERTAAIDGWEALQHTPPTQAEYAIMSEKIKSSSLLPLSRLAEQRQGAAQTTAAAGPQDTPPFPKILGGTKLNKTQYVLLLGPEQTSMRAKAEDVLESGWEIKSITDTQVKASFDGEEFEFPIVPYLQSAFEKTEESAMDVSEDVSGTRKPTPPSTGGGGE